MNLTSLCCQKAELSVPAVHLVAELFAALFVLKDREDAEAGFQAFHNRCCVVAGVHRFVAAGRKLVSLRHSLCYHCYAGIKILAALKILTVGHRYGLSGKGYRELSLVCLTNNCRLPRDTLQFRVVAKHLVDGLLRLRRRAAGRRRYSSDFGLCHLSGDFGFGCLSGHGRRGYQGQNRENRDRGVSKS
ncbi:hypothetical protein BMS3Bbin02_00039 [bacterium BMS3Bbin02]|nr:hypothetical protein BMS3Bbin02_00039 [bacterium BMS3Bbin02]